MLRPDLSEDEWEEELARFESSLDKAGVTEIDSLVRGRQRMAYPINGCIYGLFVLYTFIGDPSVGRAVQKVRPDRRARAFPGRARSAAVSLTRAAELGPAPNSFSTRRTSGRRSRSSATCANGCSEAAHADDDEHGRRRPHPPRAHRGAGPSECR